MSDIDERDYLRIQEELIDSIDEEFEAEIEDGFELTRAPLDHRPGAPDRRTYFRELLRLQRELITLQDWSWSRRPGLPSCSRVAMPRGRAAPSSASRSA